LTVASFDCALSSATTCQRVVDQQHNDRSRNCDDHAPDVQAGNAGRPKKAKYKSTDKSADYSERDVEPEALTLTINNLASDEPKQSGQE
jgi:hypothetical protein